MCFASFGPKDLRVRCVPAPLFAERKSLLFSFANSHKKTKSPRGRGALQCPLKRTKWEQRPSLPLSGVRPETT